MSHMDSQKFLQNPMKCAHCSCSTAVIGSKLLTDFLDVGSSASDLITKPTILEALTLVLGFHVPPPEVVINTCTGIKYFNKKGEPFQNMSICVNCESVLTNLYKVFLLFTELSNGKKSLILENSIISGRLEKEVEVIPLDDLNQKKSNSKTIPSNQITQNTLNTVRRELTSEVIAEMYVPSRASANEAPVSPSSTAKTSANALELIPLNNIHVSKGIPNISPAKKSDVLINQDMSVEVITLDEDDDSSLAQSTVGSSTGISPQTKFHPLHASTPKPSVQSRSIAGAGPSTHPNPKAYRSQAPKRQAPFTVNHTQTKSVRVDHQPSGLTDPLALSVLTQRKGLVTTVTTATAKHKCDLCQLHFPTQPSLLCHVEGAHMNHLSGHPKKITCNFCFRKFTSAALFQTHLQYHNKDAICYKCSYPGCHKKYYELRLLRRHQTMTQHFPELSLKSPSPNSEPQSDAVVVPIVSKSVEKEDDYWTSGIQVIHDPEQVMKTIDSSNLATEKENGVATSRLHE